MRALGLALLLVWGWAQEGRAEQLKSLRIALITEALELTPEEAQTFWPVYNAREAALQKHREDSSAVSTPARRKVHPRLPGLCG